METGSLGPSFPNEIKPRVLVLAGSRRIRTACKYLKDRYDFYLLTFFNPTATPSGVPEDGTDAVKNMAIRLELERDYFRDTLKVENLPDFVRFALRESSGCLLTCPRTTLPV